MRAMVCERQAKASTAPLVLLDLDDPEPGPGEVRIGVRACGVCRTDLHVVEGDLPLRSKPAIPGHQVVGLVDAVGEGTDPSWIGKRVGAAWLLETCGTCRFCGEGRENLCRKAEFLGWTRPGGFAERVCAPADFVYELPEGFPDLQAAPLLCAGIIGYRALSFCVDAQEEWEGLRLGLVGFGAAAHVAIQVAGARGARVTVFTRQVETRREAALALGAVEVGELSPNNRPEGPGDLDAVVVFAPSGAVVPPSLDRLAPGGRLVLAGIHMTDTPPLPYRLLYDERRIQSVRNNTREDGRAFLAEAARIPVETRVEVFPLEAANEALARLAEGSIQGAAVLRIG